MKHTILIVSILFSFLSCTNIPVHNFKPNSVSNYPAIYYSEDSLLLSDWGYNRDDSTGLLQKAINSKYKVIIIPAEPGPWKTRPLFIYKDDLTIILEKGAQLLAKRGSYMEKGDSLLTLNGVKNISIYGYGAIMQMWRDDYDKEPYEHSEWRHGIKILSCNNINIYGLTIMGTGGDGIYISQLRKENFPLYSSNIVIKDMKIIDNYRQGISVISARNLLIDNCYISGTKGTPPEAGIDFEPNRLKENFVNCKVTNCEISHNNGAGILIWLKSLDAESTPIDITIENCTIYKNGWGLGVYLGGIFNNPLGQLIIKNNEISFFNILPKKSVEIYNF